jgi:uncharacterized protein YjbI with pentapeptide repeats
MAESASPEHIARLREGVESWNRWRRDHPEVSPQLSYEDFDQLDMRGANLVGSKLVRTHFSIESDLTGANLDRADLTGASLFAVTLAKATLRGADLSGAYLHVANLSGADLREANLTFADLSFASLSGANLARARTFRTTFGENDLSTVEGLETVVHKGPSSVGIDTIYRSKGKIPESFLRGCGVPDDFIAYAKSFGINPVEFYSCFISYSTRDQGFADRLYADLQSKGVRCWFALLVCAARRSRRQETTRTNRRSNSAARQAAVDLVAAQYGE